MRISLNGILLFVLAVEATAGTLQSVSLSAHAKDVVWDATRSLFFVSVAANDSQWPSTVLMVNPENAQVTDSIPTGNEPDHLAVSADGQYLYVGIDSQGLIRRYHLPSHTPDFDIPLGSGAFGHPVSALSIAPLANLSTSILVARYYQDGLPGPVGPDADFAVYDGAAARGNALVAVADGASASSVYVRPSDGQAFAYDGQRIYRLAVGPSGVSATQSAYAFPVQNIWLNWSGNYATGFGGYLLNISQELVVGQVSWPKTDTPAGAGGGLGTGVAMADSSGSWILGLSWNGNTSGVLNQYSAANFKMTGTSALNTALLDAISTARFQPQLYQWGADGVLIFVPGDYNMPAWLEFAHTSSALTTPPAVPVPTPRTDATGAIHIPLATGGLVFDPTRNVIWASVLGNQGSIGNSVVPIDPLTGLIGTAIPVGSEPGLMAISDDGQNLFTALTGVPAIVPVNLQQQQAQAAISVYDPPPAMWEPYPNYWFVERLVTLPGQSSMVVATRFDPGAGNPNRSTVVYDSTGPRLQVFTGLVDCLFNGDAPNALFGLNGWTSTFDFYRLLVDSTGVTLDQKLKTINSSFGGTDAYANGKIFTWNGTIWTADTKQELGSVALDYSYPITFPGQNMVGYVTWAGTPATVAIFDLATFLPLSVSEINLTPLGPGREPIVLSAVQAGSAIAFNTANEVVIAPLSTLQIAPTESLTFQQVGTGIQEASIAVNAVAPNPTTGGLLASTPSVAFNLGNSILSIDPVAGTVQSRVFVGSEPDLLAVSPDGAYVYTYLSGAASIARFNLSTGQNDLVFSTDFTGSGQAFPVWDMALGPDGGLAVSYPNGAIVIFDNGMPRPQIYGGDGHMFDDPQFAIQLTFDDTGTTLFGYDQTETPSYLHQWSISPQGLQLVNGGLAPAQGREVRYAAGLLYTSSGYVFDPASPAAPVQFAGVSPDTTYLFGPHSNHVLPDPASGRVFFVAQNRILVFDMNSLEQLGSLTLPYDRSDYPLQIVKFSNDGLAVVTMDNELFLVGISSIPES